MTEPGLWIRARLDRHLVAIAVALAILVLVGGWVTYTTYGVSATRTVERPGSSWATTGDFDHHATVVGNNSLYPPGGTLTNRSIYFTALTPRLNGTYELSLEASEDGSVDGTAELAVFLQGVEQRQEETQVLWQTRRDLDRVDVTIQAGESVTIPFSVDLAAMANRSAAIDEELDRPPGRPRALLRVATSLSGEVNGESYAHNRTDALPVTIRQGNYRPGTAAPETIRRESTEHVVVPVEHGPLQKAGAPLLLLASLGGLGLLWLGRDRGWIPLSEVERSRLRYHRDRESYDEWISRMRLPDALYHRPRVSATSLAALADFAIDSDSRVLEDADRSRYVVVTPDHLYVYRPPEPVGRGLSPGTPVDDDADALEEDGPADGTPAPATEPATANVEHAGED